MRTTATFRPLLLGLALLPLLPPPAPAQLEKDAAELSVKHAQARANNSKALASYSSNYRIELWKKNELQWIDMVNVNVKPDGLPQFTQVNRDSVHERHGLFRNRREDRAFGKQDKIVEYALQWMIYYNRLSPDRLNTLFLKAGATNAVQTSSGNKNILGVSATNVRDSTANDFVSLWFNRTNGHPVRFSFTIPVEKTVDGYAGDKLTVVMNYRYLSDGKTFYPDHVDVFVPGKDVKIKFENLNIRKKVE